MNSCDSKRHLFLFSKLREWVKFLFVLFSSQNHQTVCGSNVSNWRIVQPPFAISNNKLIISGFETVSETAEAIWIFHLGAVENKKQAF